MPGIQGNVVSMVNLDENEKAVLEYIQKHPGQDIIKIARGLGEDGIRNTRQALNTLTSLYLVSSGLKHFKMKGGGCYFDRVYYASKVKTCLKK